MIFKIIPCFLSKVCLVFARDRICKISYSQKQLLPPHSFPQRLFSGLPLPRSKETSKAIERVSSMLLRTSISIITNICCKIPLDLLSFLLGLSPLQTPKNEMEWENSQLLKNAREYRKLRVTSTSFVRLYLKFILLIFR